MAAGMALVLPQNDAGGSPDPLALMAQVKEADPAAPVVSVAVTMTVLVAAVVGVPVISPVAEAMDRPAGSPEAV